MGIKIICICNDGYKDFLTIKKDYNPSYESELSYTILCDIGIEIVVDKSRFKIYGRVKK